MTNLNEPWVRRLVKALVVCVGAVLLISVASRGDSPGASQQPSLRTWRGRNWVVRDALGWHEADDASAPVDAMQLTAAGAEELAAAEAVDKFFAQGGHVHAFIFYGRRRYTAVQWPYLLQARRVEGRLGAGVLSKVIFVANTEDAADLDYLEQLQAANSDYVVVQHPEHVAKQGQNNADYCSLYSAVGQDPAGNAAGKLLIIKIDDDLVYMAPHALRNLVAAKLRTDYLFVSANVVNHPLLAHVHQRLGLYRAADVAEMVEAELALNQSDVEELPEQWNFGYSTFSGDGWQSGSHAALEHLMLLHRLRAHGANGAAATYGSFKLWDFDALGYKTGRWSVNCFVYDPADLVKMDLGACRSVDDEHYLTNEYPEVMGRHCAAWGGALVAHFAYYPQREWLESISAVLARYEALSRTLQQELAGDAGETP